MQIFGGIQRKSGTASTGHGSFRGLQTTALRVSGQNTARNGFNTCQQQRLSASFRWQSISLNDPHVLIETHAQCAKPSCCTTHHRACLKQFHASNSTDSSRFTGFSRVSLSVALTHHHGDWQRFHPRGQHQIVQVDVVVLGHRRSAAHPHHIDHVRVPFDLICRT